MPRLRSLCLTFLVATLTAESAFAIPITLTPVADTHLRENLPDTPQGSDTSAALLGFPGVRSYVLLAFDASMYAGLDVTGDGTLDLQTFSTSASFSPASYTIYVNPVLVEWDEDTVTWNSLGLPAGGHGAAIDSDSVEGVSPGHPCYAGAGGPASADCFFTFSSIDAALIQDWIDNPGANYGLLLTVVSTDASESGIRTTEGSGSPLPSLSFEATAPVPEPASLVLVGSGVGLVVRRYRQARTARQP